MTVSILIRRASVVAVAGLIVVALSPSAPALADAPSVTITAPLGGAAVVGSSTVSVVGNADTTTADVPTRVEVYLDGAVTPLSAPDCVVSGQDCAASFTWDASAVSDGSHVLTAKLFVDTAPGVAVATSAPVSVTVSRAASVRITAPIAGAAVVGSSTVSVVGNADTSTVDVPTRVELFLDGAVTPFASPDCAVSGQDCAVSLPWDASSVADGVHVLAAKLYAGSTLLATSLPVSVTVSRWASVRITAPVASAVVTGSVTVSVVGNSDTSTADVPTRVEVYLDGAVTPFASPDCVVSGQDCAASFTWDASAISDGPHVLTARLFAGGSLLATSPGTAVTVSSPTPSVAITSPAAAAVVTGVVTVQATASTAAALSEFPSQVELLVDGAVVGAAQPCPASVHSCDVSFSWDATGLTGSHSLTARVTTTRPRTADSASVGLTVANPAPTVTITSPGSSAVVAGTAVAIAVTAGTDPRRSDVPQTLVLAVDGAPKASVSCLGGAHICTTTLGWNASAYAGAHTLSVTVTTSAGVAGTSAPVTVFAASASRVVLTAVPTVTTGTKVTLRGRVLAATSGAPVVGVAVRITRDPALGSTSTVTVLTTAGGAFALTFTPRSTTAVTAIVVANGWLGSSRAGARAKVVAPMACSLSTSVLRAGASGTGFCRVAGLPRGNGLGLRYLVRGKTYTLATGRAKGPAIPFSFAFPRRGVYYVRVDLAAGAVYTTSSSKPLRVVVR